MKVWSSRLLIRCADAVLWAVQLATERPIASSLPPTQPPPIRSSFVSKKEIRILQCIVRNSTGSVRWCIHFSEINSHFLMQSRENLTPLSPLPSQRGRRTRIRESGRCTGSRRWGPAEWARARFFPRSIPATRNGPEWARDLTRLSNSARVTVNISNVHQMLQMLTKTVAGFLLKYRVMFLKTITFTSFFTAQAD